jgi:hypothetical protein
MKVTNTTLGWCSECGTETERRLIFKDEKGIFLCEPCLSALKLHISRVEESTLYWGTRSGS